MIRILVAYEIGRIVARLGARELDQVGGTRLDVLWIGARDGHTLRRAGEMDLRATEAVVERFLEAGVDGISPLVLQRHFALPGSAASVLGTLQRGLIIFATL
jgi:hypothetical protein